VTVMGESAGGGSTIHQVTAYGGLLGRVPFSQAIIQSGAFLPVPTNNRPEDTFQKFLTLAGVSTLQQARGLPTSALQLVNAQLVGEAPYGDFTFSKHMYAS
jgi:carboxylesterase type B